MLRDSLKAIDNKTIVILSSTSSMQPGFLAEVLQLSFHDYLDYMSACSFAFCRKGNGRFERRESPEARRNGGFCRKAYHCRAQGLAMLSTARLTGPLFVNSAPPLRHVRKYSIRV